MPKLPKVTSLLFLYNMLRKKWMMQLIFYNADKHERLLKMMVRVKNSQTSQNGKFVMSLQYLWKEVRDEADFLDADKHQSYL